MKKNLFIVLSVIHAVPTYACITCNKEVSGAIWDDTFFPNLFVLLSAFFVLGFLVIISSVIAGRKYNSEFSVYAQRQIPSPVPLTTAAVVLGMGLGGFADGIVFHQLLQWHQMFSHRQPPVTLTDKSVNMFWDGVFHLFCLLIVLTGIVMLWRTLWRKGINRSSRLLAGGMLIGWGAFNVVEGVINHHLLKLHNVREISEAVMGWNLGFLGISVLLMVAGFYLVYKAKAPGAAQFGVLSNGYRKKLTVQIK